jgi:chaperonin GroEL
VALLRCASALDKLEGLNDEQVAGINIIRRAIEAPLRFISENAGIEGSIVVDKVKGLKGANGFNAATEVYEDLIKAGVIDPAKVVRTALQHAASVSGLLLTTEAMIADKPEPAGAGGGGGMPDMGGMGGMGGMPGMM